MSAYLRNILLVVAVGLLVVLLWQLRGLVTILAIAVVIATSITPAIDCTERLRVPRFVATLLVYLMLVLTIAGVGLIAGPTIVGQIELLIQKTPAYVDKIWTLVESWVISINDAQPGLLRELVSPQAVVNWSFRSTQQLLLRSFGLTKGLFDAFIGVLLAVLISGYMASDGKNLIRGLVSLFPSPWEERLAEQVEPMGKRMGGYIQGRVTVSAILGVAITLGLGFLGLSEFAIGLGAIAGFTNLIPFFGPVIGAIPALIVALSQGGWIFLWVLLLFVLIQNLETYVLDPLLVGSTVKVHPLYQLLGVLGGTWVLGVVGAVIVPPWIAGMAVLLENLYLHPKRSIALNSVPAELPAKNPT